MKLQGIIVRKMRMYFKLARPNSIYCERLGLLYFEEQDTNAREDLHLIIFQFYSVSFICLDYNSDTP